MKVKFKFHEAFIIFLLPNKVKSRILFISNDQFLSRLKWSFWKRMNIRKNLKLLTMNKSDRYFGKVLNLINVWWSKPSSYKEDITFNSFYHSFECFNSYNHCNNPIDELDHWFHLATTNIVSSNWEMPLSKLLVHLEINFIHWSIMRYKFSGHVEIVKLLPANKSLKIIKDVLIFFMLFVIIMILLYQKNGVYGLNKDIMWREKSKSTKVRLTPVEKDD